MYTFCNQIPFFFWSGAFFMSHLGVNVYTQSHISSDIIPSILKMSGKRKQKSLTKQTPVDKQRKPDPPKEYAVDSLLKLRTRVQSVRNQLTDLKTDKVYHQEYLVR